MRNILLLISLLFFATACDAPEPRQYPPIRFTDKTPIHLDVGNIEISNEYTPSLQPPNVEHLFPVAPEQAVKAWVSDRLKPIGGRKALLVVIKDASVVKAALPTTPGIKGIFTDDQESKLVANVSVELKVYGASAISLANIEVHATRHATVPESLSLVERDDLYYRLTKDIMLDLNAELEKNIHLYFSKHVHYSHPR